MSSDCLLTAATFSVLLCALLMAAFDFVELRTRPRGGRIASSRISLPCIEVEKQPSSAFVSVSLVMSIAVR